MFTLCRIDEYFTRGYWDDQKGVESFPLKYILFLEVARKGVKLWEAPSVISSVQSSRMLPRLIGRNLSRKEVDLRLAVSSSPVNLVTFAFTGLGEGHVKTYLDAMRDDIALTDRVPVYRVIIEENWAKAWAMKLFVPWQRLKIPQAERL
ncbi:hypothetical protein HDU97_010308 [Phlyctochytrium planicorne]|nr:hypothetical protein HDU97_010308 [Phlyctochytrium planicorne]